MIVGVDIGGSSVTAGSVDFTSSPPECSPAEHALDSHASKEEILSLFSHVLSEVVSQNSSGAERVVVGMGFPGPFDYEKGICLISGVSKFENLYGADVAAHLLSNPPYPHEVRFRNDAEAALVGEARFGNAARYRRIIGLTLGTGIGSAFMVDGVVTKFPNAHSADGWLYPVLFNGVPADEIFSTRGIESRLSAKGCTTYSVADAAEEAHRGDRRCRDVFDAFGRDLGTFLAPFVESFSADAVLILGGIARSLDLFHKPLLAQLPPVEIVSSSLGDRAAVLGAAALFRDS